MANRDDSVQLERSRGSLLSIVGAERSNGYRTSFPPQPDNDQPLDFSTKRTARLHVKVPDPSLRFTPSPEIHNPVDYHSPSLFLSGNGPHITEVDSDPSPPKPVLAPEKAALLCDALSRVPSLAYGLDPTSPSEISSGLLNSVPLVDPRKPYKYTRPFKAYPRDPLNVPLGYYGLPMQLPLAADAMVTQTILSSASDQAYLQFREQMMATKRTCVEQRRNGMIPPSGNKSFDGSDNESLSAVPTSTEPNGMHSKTDCQDSCDSDEKMCNTVGTSSSINGDDHDKFMHMSRKRGRSLPEELKDDAYWERRRKNNEAAKRSRDARRAKEDEIAIRAAFLEQENLRLRVELAGLKKEYAKIRCLYNYNS